MKNKSLHKIMIGAATASVFALTALSFVLGGGQKVHARQLIQTDDSVSVEYGYTVPESTGLTEERAGVKISTGNSGDSVTFDREFKGTFALDFRVVSAENYTGSLSASLGASFINNELELNEMSLRFTSTKGEGTFALKLSAGAPYDVVTPTARVAVGNAECGLHYYNGQTVPSNTGIQNSLGYYTRLNGTSFCNVAYTNGILTSEGVKPMQITFEPSTMRLYGMYYGQSASLLEKRLILDLKDGAFIGENTLDVFTAYNVSLVFDDVVSGKTASVVLYELNGCEIGTETVSEKLPVIFPEQETEGVVGEKYVFPKPTQFFLNGAAEEKQVAITVADAKGATVGVYTKEGQPTNGIYSDGCYFTPTADGLYSVTYRAVDGSERGVAAESQVRVFRNIPEPEYVLSGEYENGRSVGIGYELELLSARYSSDYLVKNKHGAADITLKHNGELVERYDGGASAKECTAVLDRAGEYEIIYSVPDFNGGEKSFAFTVIDGKCNFRIEGARNAYMLGQRITLPTVTAMLAGEEARATAVVIEPDGTLNVNLYPVFTQKGTHKFVYSAVFGNTVYQRVDEFTVDESEAELFVSERDSEIKTEATLNYSLSDIRGLQITGFSDGASVRYAKTIDLSKKTRQSSLIELAVIPTEYGVEDFCQLTITLTDLHDSTNFVKITVYKGSWGNSISFVKAAAKGQVVMGLEKGKPATRFDLGTSVMMSFTGNRVIGSETLKLYYDNEEKAVYADALRTPTADGLVNDFDSADLQGENSVWNGFTTGEVILTVSQTSFNGASGSYLITSIDGQPLGNRTLDDVNPPEIFIDTLGYGKSAPVGVAGTPYTVFEASAFDRTDAKSCAVSRKVWLRYGTAEATEYALVGDKFTPDRSGVYTVEYTAYDTSGNVAVATYSVNVADALDPMELQWITAVPSSAFVGKTISAPVVSATGGSGEKKVVFSLERGGSSVSDLTSPYLFTAAGDYLLKATVTDYIGTNSTFTKNISVTLSQTPIVEFPVLPDAFVNGKTYVLPAFDAIDYSSGQPVQATVEKLLIVEGESPVLIEGNTLEANFAREVTEVTVRLSARASGGGTELRDYRIAVLHATDEEDVLHMEKLFLCDGVTATANRMDTDFIALKDGASFKLVNPVVADDLVIEFGGLENKSAFGSLKITLTDAENPSLTLSFVVTKRTGNVSGFASSGAKRSTVNGSFVGNAPFRFEYKNSTQVLYDMTSLDILAKFAMTDDGREFHGFVSSLVYVRFEFCDVTGEGGIALSKIANQPITDRAFDAIAPELAYEYDVPLKGVKGEKLTLPRAVVADVIDPNATVSLTVVSPKGERIVELGDATKTVSEFVPSDYGAYLITYRAKDEAGNVMTQTYRVTVPDLIKPQLTVNGTVPATAKVGKTVKLPTATATDDATENLQVTIYIVDPKGVMTVCSGEFKPLSAGVYTIRYFVRDDNYNYASAEFKLTVN